MVREMIENVINENLEKRGDEESRGKEERRAAENVLMMNKEMEGDAGEEIGLSAKQTTIDSEGLH